MSCTRLIRYSDRTVHSYLEDSIAIKTSSTSFWFGGIKRPDWDKNCVTFHAKLRVSTTLKPGNEQWRRRPEFHSAPIRSMFCCWIPPGRLIPATLHPSKKKKKKKKKYSFYDSFMHASFFFFFSIWNLPFIYEVCNREKAGLGTQEPKGLLNKYILPVCFFFVINFYSIQIFFSWKVFFFFMWSRRLWCSETKM